MSESRLSLREFLSELKRRRVFRVALVYSIVAYAVLQAAQVVFTSLNLPDWAFRALVICGIVGFPVALVLGWAFDLLPARPASWGASGATGTTNGGIAGSPRTPANRAGEPPSADRATGAPAGEVSPAPGVVVLGLLFALAVAAVAGWCGFLRSENATVSERSNASLTRDAGALHLGAAEDGPAGMG